MSKLNAAFLIVVFATGFYCRLLFCAWQEERWQEALATEVEPVPLDEEAHKALGILGDDLAELRRRVEDLEERAEGLRTVTPIRPERMGQ